MGYCPLANVRDPERDGPGAGEPAVMMKAARTTRQFGGALAVALVFVASAATAEPVKPGLKPAVPGTVATASQVQTVALAEVPDQQLLARIPFAPQSVDLTQAGMRGLTRVAEHLSKNPAARIAVVAYAGSDGV